MASQLTIFGAALPAVTDAPPSSVKEWIAEKFEQFWIEYPPREGGNPRKTAMASFARAVTKLGKNPDHIIAAARIFAAQRARENPRFTPMAATWLNQERFEDASLRVAPRAKSFMDIVDDLEHNYGLDSTNHKG